VERRFGRRVKWTGAARSPRHEQIVNRIIIDAKLEFVLANLHIPVRTNVIR
jgi:hypothetical protein